ncbi:alpha/beta-Hydrolases superfamily protein [Citrus sinensis]|nr:alpha/beta-Hydrolases superfamily protein [Citrus sinensis]
MVEEFMPVPQLCRLILVVYEDDLCNPTWPPPGGGLNLAKEGDYAVLLDNKLGQTKFDGGYVHNGLLKVARWVFHAEWVVALLVLIEVQNLDKLGSIERNKIRRFAIVDLEWL